MKKLTLFAAAIVLFCVASSTVYADQYGPYQGPQQSMSVLVDKFVGVPALDSNGNTVYNYVDNLGVSDYKFKGDNYVFFKIKVRNTANTQLDNVVIKDYAPASVELFTDPGTYDSTTQTLTINVGTLYVNQEKEYIVKGRVTGESNLSTGITCVVNKAVASNDKVSDDDTAQLCIEKQVLSTSTTTTTVPPVTSIPSTGPEAAILVFPLSAMLGWAGLKLRKQS